MSPTPMASVTFAPQPSSSFSRKAGSPPPGSPATRTRLDARLAQVVALGQVRGIRRREDDGLRLQRLDRADQALGVSGPDRDVHEPDALERGQRRARDERAGVVSRDDPLAGLDARSRVAP